MTSQSKIPHSEGNGNVAIITSEYVSKLNALQNRGASIEFASFVFNNCGIVFSVCQRLTVLREQDIEERILWDLLLQVFE